MIKVSNTEKFQVFPKDFRKSPKVLHPFCPCLPGSNLFVPYFYYQLELHQSNIQIFKKWNGSSTDWFEDLEQDSDRMSSLLCCLTSILLSVLAETLDETKFLNLPTKGWSFCAPNPSKLVDARVQLSFHPYFSFPSQNCNRHYFS